MCRYVADDPGEVGLVVPAQVPENKSEGLGKTCRTGDPGRAKMLDGSESILKGASEGNVIVTAALVRRLAGMRPFIVPSSCNLTGPPSMRTVCAAVRLESLTRPIFPLEQVVQQRDEYINQRWHLQLSCPIPATDPAAAAIDGLTRCQTSSKGCGGALQVQVLSRIMPWKRTLAICRAGSLTTSSSSASNAATSVVCAAAVATRKIDADLGKHLRRREFANVIEVAGIVGRLQAEEIELGHAQKPFLIESGGDYALRPDVCRAAPRTAQRPVRKIASLRRAHARTANTRVLHRLAQRAEIRRGACARHPEHEAAAARPAACISMSAMPSPRPKCESRAASPMPAASPASGPIQLRPAGGAVGCRMAEGVAAACALGLAAAWPASAFTDSRCMPFDAPPPRRFASAS